MSWTSNSANETGFKIERKTGAGGTYAQIATVGAGVVVYNDSGLVSNTTYFYRVRATNAIGDSAYSNEASATTQLTAPAAPSGLSAASISPSQINLVWTDNSSNETGFKIERKTGSGGTYAQIATVAASVTTYSDTTGLTFGTGYFYRVRATNAGGDSAYSNEASATTLTTIWPPNATPAIIDQLDVVPSTELGVRFTSDRAGWIKSIRFYKASTNTGTHVGHLWTNTGTLLATVTFTNETTSGWQQMDLPTPIAITAGTPYVASYYSQSRHFSFDEFYFAGQGYDQAPLHALADGVAGPNGLFHDSASAFPTDGYHSTNFWIDVVFSDTLNAIPNAPTGLVATAFSSTQINLSWTDNSTNETGFKIERKTGSGGTYAEIATVGADVTAFSDTGLTATTAYFYRVRATNATGDSAYSNEASATTLTNPPVAPSGLTATAISSSQINISWTDVANETGFKIERKTGAGGTYSQIATVGAGVVSYNNTGLTVNTTYYYRVRASNAGGDSPYSNEANATTLNAIPAPPSGLTATAFPSQINLSWVDNSPNETGFKIERKTGSGGTYAEIATVGAGITAYNDTGLAATTTYFYRVRATNTVGDSAYSNEASATTPDISLAAPSDLTATAASSSQINLAWTDNSTNETGFKIERKTGAGGTYSQIATVAAGVVAYGDTALLVNTTLLLPGARNQRWRRLRLFERSKCHHVRCHSACPQWPGGNDGLGQSDQSFLDEQFCE